MKLGVVVSTLLLVLCSNLVAEQPSIVHDPAKGYVEVGADRITLRKDLPLVLSLKQAISSAANKAGDTIEFEVIRPVMAGDLVVIAKGSVAKATLSQADPAGHLGKHGELELKFSGVQLVTGETVPLTGTTAFDAGSKFKRDAGSSGLIPAAGLLLFGKGGEASVPKFVHLPARLTEEFIVSRASCAAKQPLALQPRSDVGYIYIYRDAEPEYKYNFPVGFMLGEKHYAILADTAVRIELPPGDYWLRVGSAVRKKLSKVKPADLTRVTLKGGQSYYATYKVVKRDLAISDTEPEAGEDHVIATQMVWDYPLAAQTPEALSQLKAQPTAP